MGRGLLAAVAACAVVAAGAAAAASAGATTLHGFPCSIGLPENQFFTTDTSVLVVTDGGAQVTHCTFTGTGYTPPASPFPFNCYIGPDLTPADVTELHMTQGGTITLTCVARPG